MRSHGNKQIKKRMQKEEFEHFSKNYWKNTNICLDFWILYFQLFHLQYNYSYIDNIIKKILMIILRSIGWRQFFLISVSHEFEDNWKKTSTHRRLAKLTSNDRKNIASDDNKHWQISWQASSAITANFWKYLNLNINKK